VVSQAAGAERGIDSTPYQTSSIAKLIVDRFGIEPLPSPRFWRGREPCPRFDGGAPETSWLQRIM